MEIVVVLITGILFACGVYALLARSLFRALLGILLLSQAANLAVFSAAGVWSGAPAILPVSGEAQETVAPAVADPLPQALVLTAIVIGFGLAAFAIALFAQAAQSGAEVSPDRQAGETGDGGGELSLESATPDSSQGAAFSIKGGVG
jgi:multicomponent Na+:H+ antiporter subunit C